MLEVKRRVGDWDGDAIIGAGQCQAPVSVVERKFTFTVLAKVECKTAVSVSEVIIPKLKRLKALAPTLTIESGTEFAEHEQIARNSEAKTFFHPYCSWGEA